MPILKPYLSNEVTSLDEDEAEDLSQDAINLNLDAALSDAGLKPKTNKDQTEIQQIFSKHGAGIEDVAKEISNIMSRGENEGVRLRAAEMVAKVHGILAEIDDNVKIPEIKINIIGSENKTLINLVMPR